MRDPNQDFLDDPHPEPPLESTPRLDLRPWLLIVTVAGIGALIAGQAELAGMAAIGGLFAMAHAADLDARRGTAYRALAWIVPIGSAIAFASLTFIVKIGLMDAQATRVVLAIAGVGVLVSLATAYRPFADRLARGLFRDPAPSRVLRLAARLAVVAILFSIAGGLSFPAALEQLTQSGTSLVGGVTSLWGNLVGMTLIALGGVGFLVRLDWRATASRLGLTRIEPRHAVTMLVGVATMFLVNAGAEWMQKTWFPALWASDQRVNQMIAGNLTKAETLMLGLSAGFGEEIALRGALQPRLGVLRTALLFALLHVQYSWFGIAIIALLGLVLGWIRRSTSTTAAIVVHGVYDVAAVLTLNS